MRHYKRIKPEGKRLLGVIFFVCISGVPVPFCNFISKESWMNSVIDYASCYFELKIRLSCNKLPVVMTCYHQSCRCVCIDVGRFVRIDVPHVRTRFERLYVYGRLTYVRFLYLGFN